MSQQKLGPQSLAVVHCDGRPPSKPRPPSVPGFVQVPDVPQVDPPRQATHAAPAKPWPHCAVVNWLGCRQALPSQQPVQVLALQVAPPLQTPDWQLWPAVESQAWQKPPLRPHWVFKVPPTQLPVLMSMQPLQVWQLPKTQVLPIWQLWHALPPAPQREGVVVLMHTPAAVQQPEGQVLGEQEELLPPPPPVIAPPPPPVPDTQAPEEEHI